MSKKITITLNEKQADLVTMTLGSHMMSMYEYDFDGNTAPLDRHSAAEVRVLTNVINKIDDARK
jgi:hypothetical protein